MTKKCWYCGARMPYPGFKPRKDGLCSARCAALVKIESNKEDDWDAMKDPNLIAFMEWKP